VPLPGPRLPVDGRVGRSRGGDPSLIRSGHSSVRTRSRFPTPCARGSRMDMDQSHQLWRGLIMHGAQRGDDLLIAIPILPLMTLILAVVLLLTRWINHRAVTPRLTIIWRYSLIIFLIVEVICLALAGYCQVNGVKLRHCP